MNKVTTLISCCAFLLAGPVVGAETVEPVAQKAVLVTGASTGIGRKITERLAAAGWFVYAGARKEADLAELDAIANVDSVRLDVTKPEEIAAAVESITRAGRGLYGVVNNAGVAIAGPLLQTSEEDFDFLFDVNVYGAYRITKAFSPLIIASKGRITNIGSISGTLSAPDLAAYSMSKHAIEAFTDSLAGELAPLEVKVSVIEPGNYRSEIGRTAEKRSGATSRISNRDKYPEPDAVAEAVLHALSDANPQRRYLVVPNQAEAEWTIRKQIEELVQLNGKQPYSYDRTALIEMLDAARASFSGDAAAAEEPSAKGRLLSRMSWMDAKAALAADTVVVIPLGGGSKEHGLHLPLDTDFRQAEYYKDRVLAEADVVIAPTMNYSYYPAFVEYPGSTSLSLPVARESLLDVIHGIARFGPRRFYVINIGVSTNKPLSEAAAVLALEGIALRYLDLTGPAVHALEQQVLTQKEGSHADEIETSAMLAIDASAVDMKKAAVQYKQGAWSSDPASPRYNASGVYGDATLATVEKGRIVLDGMAQIILGEIESLRHEAPPKPATVFGRLEPQATKK